tara:strand:- start:399 stop:737 length:339 start_codon:yes stop_codon:yes gene_type:complete
MRFLSILLLAMGLFFVACEDDAEVEAPDETTHADAADPDSGATEESDATEEEEADTTVAEDAVETEEVTEAETDVEEPEPEAEETPEGDPTEFRGTNFRFNTPTPGSPGGDD